VTFNKPRLEAEVAVEAITQDEVVEAEAVGVEGVQEILPIRSRLLPEDSVVLRQRAGTQDLLDLVQ
jgi:hypothetical protein